MIRDESNRNRSCPCKSGMAYSECCKPFHDGQLPETALKLMRSRYSAYALCILAYIIHTTHPKNPQFCGDISEWSKEKFEFCKNTEFRDLEILNFEEEGLFATVILKIIFAQQFKVENLVEPI